jgi:hypothetical protein
MTRQAKSAKMMRVTYNGYVLAETIEVTDPPFSVAKDDGTSQDSTHKVHLPGDSEFGDMTFTCFAIDDTCQTALETLAYAKTGGIWKIVYPSTYGVAFKTKVIDGWISNLRFGTPKSGRATLMITITPYEDITTVTTAGAPLTTPFLSNTNQASEALTLSPAAAAATYKYAVTAYSDDTGVKITATATTGTIYINGTSVASGVASAAITLNSGTGATTTIFVMVVESDAKTPKIYQIDVTIGTVLSPT